MKELPTVEQMKRYLYGEFNKEEEAVFEDEFFENDEFFDNLKTLENDLIDRFAAGLMKPEENRRFETALAKFPARREKLANAIALQSYIESSKSIEKPLAVTTAIKAEEKPLWLKLFSGLFDFRLRAYPLATAGALVLLAFCGVWLYSRNYSLQTELAQVKDNQAAIERRSRDLREKESELQNRLAETQLREQDLQKSEAEKTKEILRLGDELNKTRESLKKQLDSRANADAPRREGNNNSQMLAVLLSPLINTRGDDVGAEQIKLSRTAKILILSLELPVYSNAANYQVKLNGKIVRSNLKARAGRGGFNYLNFRLPASDLKETNTFTVSDTAAARTPRNNTEISYQLNIVN